MLRTRASGGPDQRQALRNRVEDRAVTVFRFNNDEREWLVHDAGLPVEVERDQVTALKAELSRRRAAGLPTAGTFQFKPDTAPTSIASEVAA